MVFMRKGLGRFVGFLVVTVVAVLVAISVTAGGLGRKPPEKKVLDLTAAPTPVSVKEIQLEPVEITDSYVGMIRPLERFTLGFEVAGRVAELGPNQTGEPLDDGDEVAADQVLARLDNRAHLARVEEIRARYSENQARLKDASARREKAHSDMQRAEDLRSRGGTAITDEAYQQYVTDLAVAEAQHDAAKAQVAASAAQYEIVREDYYDTILRSPVQGIIAKRHANAGESVSPHQPVMEIIQVDRVLLVVGVPEAYIGHVQVGQKSHVELLARDSFGQKRPTLDGRVYLVSEAADQMTGLFEVEIVIDNPKRRWKPGMIAVGHIVVEEMQGFRIPLTCGVFRDQETFFFSVDASNVARKVPLDRWIEQGQDLIVEQLAPEHRRVVVRGQHRLVDGRTVEFVDLQGRRLSAADGESPLADTSGESARLKDEVALPAARPEPVNP